MSVSDFYFEKHRINKQLYFVILFKIMLLKLGIKPETCGM
ncbi:hypothetical protein FHW89_003950 [Mucilaginibacter sp. SG564]|nr:hypothetical protein [Mucilaginibacter sp. SG564]